MKKKTILVAGGAGFIGSHITKMLQRSNYQTIVLDNLSRGNRHTVSDGLFIKGDIGDTAVLESIFKNYSIDAVMHFAAFIDVGESIQQPGRYYSNNVAQTITLLESMISHQVNNFIFSSSAAIFGNPRFPLISENHPCIPINPYGKSKWIIENILEDLSIAHGLKFCTFRYFNAAGGDPKGEIKHERIYSTNLIPLALKSIIKASPLIIFGDDYPTKDGTCVRDYIHIEDLGTAHIFGLQKLMNNGNSCSYNLGNGIGYTVKEVIDAVQLVTKKKIEIKIGCRRPGDPAILVADSKKAKEELNWQIQYPQLETIVQHAWQAVNRGSLNE